MTRRLYRSRTNKMIAGVCGGMAEYLNADATLVRLLFLLIGIPSGIGFAVYLVMWVLVPYEGANITGEGAAEMASRARDMGQDVRDALNSPNPQAGIVIGAALVIWGVFALLRSLDIPWLAWMRADVLWPVLLILLGAVLIWRVYRDRH